MIYVNYQRVCLQFFLRIAPPFFSKTFFLNVITPTNHELIKYREWTVANRLSLINGNKTHVMISTTKPIPCEPKIDYHQQILIIKEENTFFGVTLNDKLKFNKHINK